MGIPLENCAADFETAAFILSYFFFEECVFVLINLGKFGVNCSFKHAAVLMVFEKEWKTGFLKSF